MHLGFHYHVPACYDAHGNLTMPGYLGRFIDSLAAYCDNVICFLHSPRPEEISLMDYRIASNNVSLVDIGPHASIVKRTLKSNTYTAFLRRYAADMDILLVRGPSPLLSAIVNKSPVPTALLLVGDYVAGVNDLPQPRWRKEMIRLWSYWNKWGQNRAASHSLTFVNSRVLYDELKGKAPHLHETRTTTLTKDDFFIRSDTCQTKPYHLLYVGRMDRSKGLLQMVEAVDLLNKRGEDVVLNLVGWKEHSDPILEEIQDLANKRKIADRVCYLGSRPLGPELFDFYKQADIFLIASLSSFEGFPRAIWEAMAHSLPVVATRVGSIPAFIQDAAELVEPANPRRLAEAISRLLHSPSLRQEYIQQGMALARLNTLEIQTDLMIKTIEDWLSKQ